MRSAVQVPSWRKVYGIAPDPARIVIIPGRRDKDSVVTACSRDGTNQAVQSKPFRGASFTGCWPKQGCPEHCPQSPKELIIGSIGDTHIPATASIWQMQLLSQLCSPSHGGEFFWEAKGRPGQRSLQGQVHLPSPPAP